MFVRWMQRICYRLDSRRLCFALLPKNLISANGRTDFIIPWIGFETIPSGGDFCNYIDAANYDRLGMCWINNAADRSTSIWFLPAFDGNGSLTWTDLTSASQKLLSDHHAACKWDSCSSVSEFAEGTCKISVSLALEKQLWIVSDFFRQAHSNFLQHWMISLSSEWNFSRVGNLTLILQTIRLGKDE